MTAASGKPAERKRPATIRTRSAHTPVRRRATKARPRGRVAEGTFDQAGLTPKQAAFVREYLIDHDATKASVRSGYSPRTASQIGYRLVQKSSVAAAIDAGERRLAEQADMSALEVRRRLAAIARADVLDFMEWTADGNIRVKASADLARHQSSIIEEISSVTDESGTRLRFKLRDQLGALKTLASVHGLLKQKHEHRVSGLAAAARPDLRGMSREERRRFADAARTLRDIGTSTTPADAGDRAGDVGGVGGAGDAGDAKPGRVARARGGGAAGASGGGDGRR